MRATVGLPDQPRGLRQQHPRPVQRRARCLYGIAIFSADLKCFLAIFGQSLCARFASNLLRRFRNWIRLRYSGCTRHRNCSIEKPVDVGWLLLKKRRTSHPLVLEPAKRRHAPTVFRVLRQLELGKSVRELRFDAQGLVGDAAQRNLFFGRKLVHRVLHHSVTSGSAGHLRCAAVSQPLAPRKNFSASDNS